MTPEEKARQAIDSQLVACGWVVQAKDKINLSAARGIVISELSFSTGELDCTLFAEGEQGRSRKSNGAGSECCAGCIRFFDNISPRNR